MSDYERILEERYKQFPPSLVRLFKGLIAVGARRPLDILKFIELNSEESIYFGIAYGALSWDLKKIVCEICLDIEGERNRKDLSELQTLGWISLNREEIEMSEEVREFLKPYSLLRLGINEKKVDRRRGKKSKRRCRRLFP